MGLEIKHSTKILKQNFIIDIIDTIESEIHNIRRHGYLTGEYSLDYISEKGNILRKERLLQVIYFDMVRSWGMLENDLNVNIALYKNDYLDAIISIIKRISNNKEYKAINARILIEEQNPV